MFKDCMKDFELSNCNGAECIHWSLIAHRCGVDMRHRRKVDHHKANRRCLLHATLDVYNMFGCVIFTADPSWSAIQKL